jgi:hypothetical protein
LGLAEIHASTRENDHAESKGNSARGGHALKPMLQRIDLVSPVLRPCKTLIHDGILDFPGSVYLRIGVACAFAFFLFTNGYPFDLDNGEGSIRSPGSSNRTDEVCGIQGTAFGFRTMRHALRQPQSTIRRPARRAKVPLIGLRIRRGEPLGERPGSL